jgi:hypothetical protein
MTSVPMIALVLSLAAPAALELSAPPELSCPEVEIVRARLIDLGVDLESRDAVADWAPIEGRIHLRVRSAARTSSTAGIERDFSETDCGELAQILALAIERATAPIGAVLSKPAAPVRAARPVEVAPELERWAYGARAGFLILRSARTQYGAEAGFDLAAPWSGPFSASLSIGGVVPAVFESSRVVVIGAQRAGFRIGRLDAALGLALDLDPAPAFSAGLSASFLLDYAHAAAQSPTLIDSQSASALREGFKGAAWIALRWLWLELRLESALRTMRSVTFHAVPGAFADLPALEGEVLVALGARNFF